MMISRLSILVLGLLLLSACGKSDGGKDDTVALPSVSAGADQVVNEGTQVSLIGNATASDSLLWQQTAGPAVQLMTPTALSSGFTAPLTSNPLTLRFSLTARNSAGQTAEDTVEITVNPVNNLPVVSAGSTQTVAAMAVVTLTASAQDSDGSIASRQWTQISGANVALTNADSLTAHFTAPVAGATESLRFRFSATDNEGGVSSDEVTVMVVSNNTAPVAAAGADMSATSGAAVSLNGAGSSDADGSITAYQWTQIGGSPSVVIANADTANASFTAPDVAADTQLTFQLQVTDNVNITAVDSVVVTVQPRSISGQIRYDNVPHNAATSGLDYANTHQDPVRGAKVELVDSVTQVVLASTQTNAQGHYRFVNPSAANPVVVRVSASLLQSAAGAGTPSWDIQVVDNTNSDALYTLQNAAFAISNQQLTKNLTAESGWGGSAYTSPRAAAPFHILDRAYDMLHKLLAVDADIQLPALKINWSINNVPTDGDSALGQIGTSHYVNGKVFVLGDADSDTDEYDGHVLIHEMGHYLEDKLSRSDSVGGSHSDEEYLDMRVAFGEGFGNAWSGMITDDPVYIDSNGAGQATGFTIDVESDTTANPGWFSEASVQAILYDLYDATNEGGDSQDALSLGLAPIYNVLVGAQKTTPALTSIFSFISNLKVAEPDQAASIDNIVAAQSIVSSTIDIYGSTETNNAGGNLHVLPVYTELVDGAAAVNLCSVDDFDAYGDVNKLSEYRFARFTVPAEANYTITATPTAPAAAETDPDFEVYRNGRFIATAESGWSGEAEAFTQDLQAGEYTLVLYNYSLLDSQPTFDGCFDITLVKN